MITCKNMDEMMALAGEWGIELPDDVLDAVAGGGPALFCGGDICCLGGCN